jgi:hypothetical protein
METKKNNFKKNPSDNSEIEILKERIAKNWTQIKNYEGIRSKFKDLFHQSHNNPLDQHNYDVKSKEMDKLIDGLLKEIQTYEQKIKNIKEKQNPSNQYDQDSSNQDSNNPDSSEEDEVEHKSSIVKVENDNKDKKYYHSYHNINEERKEFDKRNANQSNQFNSNETSTEVIKVKTLIKDQNLVSNALKKMLVYVVSFFKDLSVSDFDNVLIFLLKDKQILENVISKSTNDKGEEQTIETPTVRYLSQEWLNDSDRRASLMQECYLKSVQLENLARVIDFSYPYLRQDAKQVFETEYSLFITENFNQVRFLLFDSSLTVAINAIDISVEMAVSNPELYSKSWLDNLCELLKNYESIDEGARMLSQSDESKETNIGFNEWFHLLAGAIYSNQAEEIILFKEFLYQNTWTQKKKFFFERLTALIAKMLEYPQLKEKVKSFLDWLVSLQYQDEALEVIKLLYSSSYIDQLYWMKHLLDRGSSEVRKETYSLLFSMLNSSPEQIYEILQNVHAWLPELKKKSDKFSHSNEYALRLIYEYSFKTMEDLEHEDYGFYFPKYKLFKYIYIPSLESNVKLLVELLFYPSLEYILNDDVKIAMVAGELLCDWYSILLGFSKEPKLESVGIANDFIDHVWRFVDASQRKQLVSFWNDLSNILLDRAESLRMSGNEVERKKIMQKRNLVRQLRSHFKEIQNKAN